ncbi:GAF domain-containing protein [Roseomonas sp. CCTCC AB2023176]|uniref:GAF domain-containing protein n=1 Tax=Roseomonas sp. CCTCC AB2023176 TaxID=3342640 RepID=UPI0035DA930F
MDLVAPPPAAEAPDRGPPAPPWDESARLRALLRYGILDTPREADFDDIAAMAAEICGTPIAVVNLVATDRQWFKAEVGIGVDSTPLDSSFCAKAILTPGITEVPDAREDPRFARNPLVTPANGIRFYAGALLETPEGLPIGTVCVLDTRTRRLTDFQRRTLSRLARQVMIQLELRRTLRDRAAEAQALRDAEERLRLAQEAGGIGAFEIEVATNILLASPASARSTASPRTRR